jgi:hypothetical protein
MTKTALRRLQHTVHPKLPDERFIICELALAVQGNAATSLLKPWVCCRMPTWRLSPEYFSKCNYRIRFIGRWAVSRPTALSELVRLLL